MNSSPSTAHKQQEEKRTDYEKNSDETNRITHRQQKRIEQKIKRQLFQLDQLIDRVIYSFFLFKSVTGFVLVELSTVISIHYYFFDLHFFSNLCVIVCSPSSSSRASAAVAVVSPYNKNNSNNNNNVHLNSDAATTTSSSTTTTTETAAAIASTGQQVIAAQENISNTVATNSLETAAARPDLRAVVSDNEPAKNERKKVGSYLFIKTSSVYFYK